MKYIGNNNNGKYILVYDFKNNNYELRNFVIKLRIITSLPIIAIIDGNKVRYADKIITDAGPFDFLTLLYHADFVISNSFHATAFSILFHKSFFTFSMKFMNNQSRMKNLITKIDLLYRYNPHRIDYCFQSIDWEYVDKRIAEIRSDSIIFLKKAMS